MCFLYEPYYVGYSQDNKLYRYRQHLAEANNNTLPKYNLNKYYYIQNLLKQFTKSQLESYIVIQREFKYMHTALLFEYYLISNIGKPLLNVDTNYCGITGSDYSIYNNYYVFDLEEQRSIRITNLNKFNNLNNCRVHTLFYLNVIMVNNRFCKLEDVKEATIRKEYTEKNYNLYKYNKESDEVDNYILKYSEVVKLLGDNCDKLLSYKRNSCKGYYLDKNICILDSKRTPIKLQNGLTNNKSNDTYTLYYYENGKVYKGIKTIKQWSIKIQSSSEFWKTLRGEIKSTFGCYKCPLLCNEDNKPIKLYNYNTNSVLVTNKINIIKDTGIESLINKIKRTTSGIALGYSIFVE